MSIPKTSVISEMIEWYEYDSETEVFDIKFKTSEDTYSFDNVPEDVAKGIESAASKGRYFKNNIKGRYRFIKG